MSLARFSCTLHGIWDPDPNRFQCPWECPIESRETDHHFSFIRQVCQPFFPWLYNLHIFAEVIHEITWCNFKQNASDDHTIVSGAWKPCFDISKGYNGSARALWVRSRNRQSSLFMANSYLISLFCTPKYLSSMESCRHPYTHPRWARFLKFAWIQIHVSV